MEPTTIPCLAKGFSAGLWVTWMLLPGHWLAGLSLLLPVGVLGILLVVIVRISWLVAPLQLLVSPLAGWNLTSGLHLISLFGAHFDCVRWTCQVIRIRILALWKLFQKKHFDFLCVRGSVTYNVTVHVHVLWPVFTHVLIRCRHTVDRHTHTYNTHSTNSVSVSSF